MRTLEALIVLWVLGVVVGVPVVLAVWVQTRDRRRGRVGRDVAGMWTDSTREESRDFRSIKRVHNLYNPDLSSTDWSRRNRRSQR